MRSLSLEKTVFQSPLSIILLPLSATVICMAQGAIFMARFSSVHGTALSLLAPQNSLSEDQFL
jgi:hypothetical protein